MIWLRELSIQAFRGVSDRIVLNLAAPVTLIYAPNGSGKTTICEAVEWLLTGAVKRLESATDIRCRFSSASTPTVVSATLEVGGDPIALERKGGGCRWRVGNNGWERVSQSDLLEKLAPSAVEEGVHRGHANPSRQIWLRGTRFLSGEALAMLLDSDDDSLIGRQRVFADLLGVGHLLETERQLDGYIAEMSQHLRNQQARLDDKDAEIKDRESKLTAQMNENRRDRLATASNYIRTAYERLGRKLSETLRMNHTSALSAVSVLRADLEGRKVLWNQKRQAELRIAADWPQRSALAQSLPEDQERLAVLAADERANEAALGFANEQLQAVAAEITRDRATIATMELRDRGLKDAQAQAEPLLRKYLQAFGLADLDAETAFAILDEEGTEQTRATRLARLHSVLADLPAMLPQRQSLEIRKNEYEAASGVAPSSETVAATQRSLRSAGEHVAALRTAYDRAAGPLEQLRHLSRTVVEALGHDESTCPVCAHDWKSAANLRQALTDAARATPASLVILDQQIRVAQAQLQAIQDQLVRENQALARAVEAERAYRLLESAFAAFATKVRQAGLEEDDAQLQVTAERAIARSDLLAVLRLLRDEARATETAIGLSAPANSSIIRFYDLLHPLLTAAIAAARDTLVAAETRHRAAAAAVAADNDNARKILSEREAVDRRIQQNGSRLQVLRSAWQSMAGDREWSDATLGEIAANLRSEYDVHQSVERTLVQAETLLRELAAGEELERLRAERKPLVTGRDRLNRYAEAALSVRQAYSDSRQKHVKQQMADFVRIISALFTRMQSNLVYDDVVSGDELAPLSWRAIAEGFSLDPEATFSQGQRQDFALSIFLARARGLGGTFILDEPVAHLDDLNRVALLDVFRAITVESTARLSLVLTTANKALVRHLLEKFARISVSVLGGERQEPVLRLISVEGNPRTGVRVIQDTDLAATL
jgi:DNA repair exonuclease SbcCD ATPase subunit